MPHTIYCNNGQISPQHLPTANQTNLPMHQSYSNKCGHTIHHTEQIIMRKTSQHLENTKDKLLNQTTEAATHLTTPVS